MNNKDDVLKDFETYLKETKKDVPRWTRQKIACAKELLNYLEEKNLSFEQVTKDTLKEYFKAFPKRKTGTGNFLEFIESRNIISLERNINTAGTSNLTADFDALLEKHLNYIRRMEVTDRTINVTRFVMRRFFQYLKDHNINDISRVTKKVMSDYGLHLLLYKMKDGRSYAANSKRIVLVCIKRFFRYLCKQDILLTDPARDVQTPKVPNKISRDVPTVAEIERMLATFDTNTIMGIRNYAIIETLYGTGIRANELYKLEVNDIDFDKKFLTVRQGKGKKDRIVPINDTALSWIREYLDKRNNVHSVNRLFLNYKNDKMRVLDIGYLITKATERAGIQKHLLPHSFRYACATHMLKNGADIRYVQEMLGHESLISTQGYTKVVKGDLKKMIRKFHPREDQGEKMNRNIFILKDKYLENERKRNLSEQSIKKTNRDLNFFFKFLGIKHRDLTDAGEINKDMIEEYSDYLEKYKKKDSMLLRRVTKQGYLETLSCWFRFLENEEYIFLNPMRNFEITFNGKELPKDILTEDEVEELLKAPDISTPVGIRDRSMLELLYGSGIRAGELTKLRMQDLDLEHCFLFITGKGRKDRIVPITKIARKFLKKYLEKARPFFLLKNPDERAVFLTSSVRPFSVNGVGTIIRKYRKKAEIKKPVSPHTLRHTCASHLIARGAGVRYVQELLGHSQITTTQIYTHVMPVDLQKVYQETHPRCLQLQGMKIEPDDEGEK